MALIAVCAAKGAPGATVSCLAFTLAWRRRILLAECDPAGGDIAAGYLRETPLGERSIAKLTASMARHRLAAADLWPQTVDLGADPGTAMTRLVLPGLIEPGQAAGLSAGWQQIAELFHGLADSDGYDVIADCGRLVAPYPPTPVLAAADLVLLVLRPVLPSIRSAAAAVSTLTRIGATNLALVVVGDGDYSAKDASLHLRVGLAAVLPHDPGTAAVLTGGGRHRGGRLLRAAGVAETGVWQRITGDLGARQRTAAIPEVSHAR